MDKWILCPDCHKSFGLSSIGYHKCQPERSQGVTNALLGQTKSSLRAQLEAANKDLASRTQELADAIRNLIHIADALFANFPVETRYAAVDNGAGPACAAIKGIQEQLSAAIRERDVASGRNTALALILNEVRQFEAIERNDDGTLVGLAYRGCAWGPCYDPSYDPYELAEKIEKWLKSKTSDEAITAQLKFTEQRDQRLLARGRADGLTAAAQNLRESAGRINAAEYPHWREQSGRCLAEADELDRMATAAKEGGE